MLTVVASLKGGSGKSTVTFNLAVWLAMAGREVIVHDLDPQGTLSDVVEVRAEEGYEPPITVRQGIRGMAKSATADNTEVLADVGLADFGAMKKAIVASDRIIVPVTPSQADIWSTQRFLDIVDQQFSAKGSSESGRPRIQAFINRGDTHHAVRESDEAAAALVTLPGVEFVKARLYQRTIYRRSFSEGLAVFEMEPRSKATHELASLAGVLFPEVIR